MKKPPIPEFIAHYPQPKNEFPILLFLGFILLCVVCYAIYKDITFKNQLFKDDE